MNLDQLVNKIVVWVKDKKDIVAVAMVGSHARNQARPDSDVDIIILSTNPQQYIEHDEWISEFGEVEKKENETWGNVFTKRVFYEKGEVEFNFSTPEWANPKDEAVKRIVTDGIKILYDPKDIFSELVSEIKK
jgi:predicted nucleotidyltransferase